MNNLKKAIFSKQSGTTFSTSIGSRFFEDRAPAKTPYPYVVYSVISSPKEKTFTEEYRNTLVQFSIYSTSQSSAEIDWIYDKLSTLYDECSLTITGSRLEWMRESNFMTADETHTTPTGDVKVKVYHVDFDVRTSKN